MKIVPRLVLATALVASSAGAQPYGPGPGMGGYGAYGMGPGMMGGYGPYGMGPGMVGDGPGYRGGAWDGRGMGPGPGMGRGPMRGWSDDAGIELDKSQQEKIEQIQREADKARWALMGSMREQGEHMHDALGADPTDEAAARKVYADMEGVHKAMFELNLATRKRIYEVLTPEQRAKLKQR